jgi:hypothetical protein
MKNREKLINPKFSKSVIFQPRASKQPSNEGEVISTEAHATKWDTLWRSESKIWVFTNLQVDSDVH